MATAIETSSEPRTPNSQAGLALASLFGAVYVVAAIAVVVYALPAVWRQAVSPWLGVDTLRDGGLRIVAQIAAIFGLWKFGRSLAGANPPKGLRGGIFLMIVVAVVIFFVVRAVGMSLEGTAGQIGMAVIGGLLLFGAYRLFTSPRGERWMIGLEEQGWFHATQYKRALGQKVRRLTILGILLVGGSGVYSLTFAGVLPQSWALAMPWTDAPVTVIPDARIVIPLLLIGLTLWIAFRIVNMPMFAEFLIATEAEMNKVSWTSRRRLVQDTIVVLVTTLMMTLFLLAVDLFWGWLLSRDMIGVLPGRATKPTENVGQEARW